MADNFQYDVFLSHSSKDRALVRSVAERLKADGLRVWFDEWEVWPGDLISLKIERGLQTSRVLVLCISVNALASDWVTLETHTAIFRDPTNKERRFVPLILDDAVLNNDVLKQFAHVDWRFKSSQEYSRLLAVCRRAAPEAQTTLVTNIEADRRRKRHPFFRFLSLFWARSLGSKEFVTVAPQDPLIFEKPNAPDYDVCEAPFAEGAYGKIWLARNSSGQWQALKIIYMSKFEGSTTPYDREFQGITNFKPLSELHVGLLRIDFVSRKKSEGYFYYVMELGDAQESGWEQSPSKYKPRDLASVLAQSRNKYLSVLECVKIGLALAETLDFLHRRGVTHRDIKPSNIIFVNGHPKLADVGLVTEIRSTNQQSGESHFGTPGYMPPPPEPTGTPQSDIYALGMLLYRIATGREPAFFPEISTRLVEGPFDTNFFRLNSIILQACEPDRTKRYTSADQLHSALIEIRKSYP